MADSGQTHGRNATTLCAVGISSELAWRDAGLQIGRYDFRSFRKDAGFGILRWRRQFLNNGFRHIQFWIFDPQPPQIGYNGASLQRSQYLLVRGAPLWGKDAEPHLCHFRLAGPEAEEFIQIAATLHNLRRDCAVDGYLHSLDVLQNALISGRLAPSIVFRLQPVDRHHNIQLRKLHPRFRNRPECTRNYLRMHSTAFNLRQHQVEFAVANQWVSADD